MPSDNSFLANEYKSRINRVLDFIDKNISSNFTLDDLANVSCFSKYHFHRIFQSIVGETPFEFILRIRLEKAATILINNPKKTITEVAYDCGFNDLSVFARSFKSCYKMSASRWRTSKSNLNQMNSNSNQSESNSGKEQQHSSVYFSYVDNKILWRTNMELNKSIEVTELPQKSVVYVRYIGPYKGDEQLFGNLFNKLSSWAGPRGLLEQKDFHFIVVYHDDPEITEPTKLRMSVSLTVPPETEVDGEIGKMIIEGGKYVVARFEVDSTQFSTAWGWLYGSWFPSSGYQPGDGPCFERYCGEPKNGIFTVDICVPVKPL